jgi:hypothetical protein
MSETVTQQERKAIEVERQLRNSLSKAFSFVRSVEINKSLSAVTLDNLISEAIALIDDSQVEEDGNETSVDSTGRSLFVVQGEEGAVVRRKGKLQRLASLAGETLSREDFATIFAGYEQPETLQDESLFDRLREYEPPSDAKETPDTLPRTTDDKMVLVTYRFDMGDGRTVEYQEYVLESRLTEEQRSTRIVTLGNLE